MLVLKEKIQNISNQLAILLSQLGYINAIKLIDLPNCINNVVIGENKLLSFLTRQLQEITELDLSGATTIWDGLFYNYRALTSITIPATVTSIHCDAFQGCDALRNIYLNSTTPPILNSARYISEATIHVPIGSGEAYKSATIWSLFAEKIVEDIEI